MKIISIKYLNYYKYSLNGIGLRNTYKINNNFL